MADVRIRFLVPYIVRDHRMGTPQQEHYAEGEEVERSDASAQHFLSRQVAVLVDAPAPVRVAAPSATEAPAKSAPPDAMTSADAGKPSPEPAKREARKVG